MNLILDGSKMTPDNWAELFEAGDHSKIPGSGLPTWYYQHNLCTECNLPLMQCRDNPFGIYGAKFAEKQALRDQMALAKTEQAEVEALEASIPKPEKVVKEKTGKKGRQRTTRLALDEEEIDTVVTRCKAGEGCTALAKEYNVPQPYLSALLKSKDCVIKRGAGAGLAKFREERAKTPKIPKEKKATGGHRGRQRTTRIALEEVEITEVLAQYDKGDINPIALAKAWNVQPPYMYALLKSNNRALKKRGSGLAKAREARAGNKPPKEVQTLTPELLNTLVERHNKGASVGTFIQETGLARQLLTDALRGRGCEIHKGRRSIQKAA